MGKNISKNKIKQKLNRRPAPAKTVHYQDLIGEIIYSTINEGRHADKSIRYILKKHKVSDAPTKQQIAFFSYDILRNFLLYTTLAEINSGKAHLHIRELIHISKLITSGEINKPKNKFGEKIKKIIESDTLNQEVRLSLPNWLYQQLQNSLGEEKNKKTLQKFLIAPVNYLRANSIKTDAKQLQYALKQEGISNEITLKGEYCLTVNGILDLFSTNAFSNGLFEVQDFASQQVVEFMDIKPGMRIIDACAGAGGKTLQIAEAMKNKGKIIAIDTHSKKLEELRKRANRASLFNIEVKNTEDTKAIKRLLKSADRVLIDAPCTGTGVLRRNPDIKFHLKPESVSQLIHQQKEILSKYCKLLKPGGKLIYSTCSLLKDENENQIKDFLQKNPDYYLEKEWNSNPVDDNCDGFYVAVMTLKKQLS